MTIEEEQRLKRVVKDALAEGLADLGLHVDDRKELRKDMQHLRKWRVLSDRVESSISRTVVVTIISGFVALVVLGFKDWIFQK